MNTHSSERIVIDTNVVVSAALFNNSPSGWAVEQAFRRGIVLMSHALLLELIEVFQRSKFDRYLTIEVRRSFLAQIVRRSTLTFVSSDIQRCRDPKDDHILNLAVDGGATLILSGDRDLAALHPFRGIEIASPAAYLAKHAK